MKCSFYASFLNSMYAGINFKWKSFSVNRFIFPSFALCFNNRMLYKKIASDWLFGLFTSNQILIFFLQRKTVLLKIGLNRTNDMCSYFIRNLFYDIYFTFLPLKIYFIRKIEKFWLNDTHRAILIGKSLDWLTLCLVWSQRQL